MIPGIGGSGRRHWQSVWEQTWESDRIQPDSWDEPDHENWLRAIERRARPGSVLVAHSLGCLAAASWLTASPNPRIAGAFLVAPPDERGPIFPREAVTFKTGSSPLPVPAVVIGSSNDPYGTESNARRIAEAWAAPYIDIGANGHIGSSDVGPWEEGRRLLTAFTAGLTGALRVPSGGEE